MKCPHCQNEVEVPYKTWEMKPRRFCYRLVPKIRIELYACMFCGKKFRRAIKL